MAHPSCSQHQKHQVCPVVKRLPHFNILLLLPLQKAALFTHIWSVLQLLDGSNLFTAPAFLSCFNVFLICETNHQHPSIPSEEISPGDMWNYHWYVMICEMTIFTKGAGVCVQKQEWLKVCYSSHYTDLHKAALWLLDDLHQFLLFLGTKH